MCQHGGTPKNRDTKQDERKLEVTLDELRNLDRAVITMSEAAKILGVDRRLVSKALDQGNIMSIPLGPRKRVIPRLAFIQLLEGSGGIIDQVA